MSVGEGRRNGAGSVDKLLVGVCAGKTIAVAAAEARMSEATAHRRLAELPVRRQLDQLRLRVAERITDALATASVGALSVVLEIMVDGDNPPSTRLRAADIILSRLGPMREGVWTEQRLAELEAAADRQSEARQGWSA